MRLFCAVCKQEICTEYTTVGTDGKHIRVYTYGGWCDDCRLEVVVKKYTTIKINEEFGGVS